MERKLNRILDYGEVERVANEGRRGIYIEGGNEENRRDRFVLLVVVDNVLMNRLYFPSMRAAERAIGTLMVKGERVYVTIYDRKKSEVRFTDLSWL